MRNGQSLREELVNISHVYLWGHCSWVHLYFLHATQLPRSLLLLLLLLALSFLLLLLLLVLVLVEILYFTNICQESEKSQSTHFLFSFEVTAPQVNFDILVTYMWNWEDNEDVFELARGERTARCGRRLGHRILCLLLHSIVDCLQNVSSVCFCSPLLIVYNSTHMCSCTLCDLLQLPSLRMSGSQDVRICDRMITQAMWSVEPLVIFPHTVINLSKFEKIW